MSVHSEPPSRALVLSSAALVPVLCMAADLAFRGRAISSSGPGLYATGAALSLLVWMLAMESARHPRRLVRAGALSFMAFTAAFGIGLQVVVHKITHAYIGRRALLLALGIPNLAQSGYITHYALGLAVACALPAAVVVGVAYGRMKWLGKRSETKAIPGFAACAVLVTSFVPFAVTGIQCLPPDVLWINGVGGPVLYALGIEGRPKALPVGQHPLPAVTSRAADDATSVVLIFGESVRRDAVCVARREGCTSSPRVDEAAPDRIGYAHAFSTASCTELSSTALWTGLPVDAGPEVFARAPLLWDWAKARGYRTAYITSQNLLFQQSDQFLRGSHIDVLREARDRQLSAHIDDGSPDEDTTAEAVSFLEAPGGPAFLVVHHANTHAPYRQAPGFTPYPSEDPKDRYRNAVVHNDAIMGDLIARIRKTERGRGAVILYVSDHGEAWGEHGSYFHSFDLYEEQIDVPLWIDAPAASLERDVSERLRREAPLRRVSMADVTATVVDLLGAPHDPALAGTSLFREAPSERDVLLWNCPPTRDCVADAFGVVSYPLKLHYVGHDHRYACHDIAVDPGETAPLPLARCARQKELLDKAFGRRDAP